MSELLTVRDVATVLKCGEDAVVRRFAKLPGVIDLGKPETRSRRRCPHRGCGITQLRCAAKRL
jgi:hypothetical protein